MFISIILAIWATGVPVCYFIYRKTTLKGHRCWQVMIMALLWPIMECFFLLMELADY